jgi:hypothetical protein
MPPPEEEIHQAWAGEKLPIGPRPKGAAKPTDGDWGPFLGKAALYRLEYGPYLVVMNSSEDREFALDLPREFSQAKDLISGKLASDLKDASIKPLSTVILYRDPAAK